MSFPRKSFACPRLGRRARQTAVVLTALISATAATASAAPLPGSIDTTFGNNGFVTLATGDWVAAAAVAVQPDGKIVTAGQENVAGGNVIVSTRMNADGSFDRSYGRKGVVKVSVGKSAGVDSGAALAIQPDGKIVIVGGGGSSTGALHFTAVRLRSNGSQDPAFDTDGVKTVPIGSYSLANAVALQPDGKILVAGGALFDEKVFAAMRLRADGSLDTTFGKGGITTLEPAGVAWGMVVQPDGKIVLGGQTDAETGRKYVAARLTPSGVLDATFGDGGIVMPGIGSDDAGLAISLRPDGKLLLTGVATTTNKVVATIRLLADGAPDAGFGTNGVASMPGSGVNAMTLAPDGKIVLAGMGSSAMRLNDSGSTDTTFGKNGWAFAPLGTNDAANGVALQSDGKIVLAGAATVSGRIVLSVLRLNG